MSAAPPGAARSGEGESVLQMLRALIKDLPGLVSDRVHLLSLELKRASVALGQMIALGVAAAVLGVTAWLALWIGLAAAAIHFGLPWGWAWAIVLALNLGGAFMLVKRALALVKFLKLPATMRRLTVPPPAPAPAPAPPGSDAPAFVQPGPIPAPVTPQPEPRPMP
ncbi:MAG: phage holin family protein [Methylibium sp.]|nr:phage holin family protein [Methylibium sp.]